MGPRAIKAYLQARGSAPLLDLMRHFDSEAGAVEGVLDFWMRRGRVRRVEPVTACAGGCGGGCCATGTPKPSSAVYEWVGAAQPLRFMPPAPAPRGDMTTD